MARTRRTQPKPIEMVTTSELLQALTELEEEGTLGRAEQVAAVALRTALERALEVEEEEEE